MARYVDAELLLRKLSRMIDYCEKDNKVSGLSALFSVGDAIMDFPTADVVEVVRCKDCMYWQDNNGGYPHEECRWGHDETPDEDDYCSFGERKE